MDETMDRQYLRLELLRLIVGPNGLDTNDAYEDGGQPAVDAAVKALKKLEAVVMGEG